MASRVLVARAVPAENIEGMTNQEHQQTLYDRRFSGIEKRRLEVWQTLARHFFHQWIRPTDTVLDVGAGYCEFINTIAAARKFALDSNPATKKKAATDVTVVSQEAIQPWPLSSESVDVVFSSNFFEHLPSKQDFSRCLTEAYRVLRPQGLLIALGPNIRYCFDVYWDFVDHHLPLSDRSMVEALEIAGFQSELVIPRFLPFTMSDGVPYRAFMVRLYLMFPLAQWLWGKQFLVVARKPKR
jgi:SAM-dependent methyltransferase